MRKPLYFVLVLLSLVILIILVVWVHPALKFLVDGDGVIPVQ